MVPVHMVTVKAGLTGVLDGFAPRPGQRVSAGEVIAHLSGPEQQEELAKAQARLTAARQTYAAAQDAASTVHQTFRLKLADKAQLDAAKEKLAAAQAGVADATAELERVQSLSTITSPATGRVVSLPAANGDRLTPGSPLLVLQPDDDLWLRAVLYNAPLDLLTPGRSARFLPAVGAGELPVRLAQVLPSLRPDGGLTAFFEPAGRTPGWRGGEAGDLVVPGEPEQVVAIPTAALILDQGHWWVLQESTGGPRRTAVRPGPSRGDETLILHGLAAGDEVVVRDAYLLFHRDFGQHYMPPD